MIKCKNNKWHRFNVDHHCVKYQKFTGFLGVETKNFHTRKLGEITVFYTAKESRAGSFPASIYLSKVNNRNTWIMCEICSKLIIKTSERHHSTHCNIFIVDFEQISHVILMFLLLTLSKWMPAGLVSFSEVAAQVNYKIRLWCKVTKERLIHKYFSIEIPCVLYFNDFS